MAPRVILPSSQVQRVWIWCRSPNEADNVATFCRETRQLTRLPELVQPFPAHDPPSWRDTLKLLVHHLPPPYSPSEWRQFWNDVDALLSSTLASMDLLQAHREDILEESISADLGLEGLRWPGVLVTDQPKLFKASSGSMLRSSLAEAAGIRDADLLPVVLSTDFKTLCGNMIVDPTLKVSESLVFSALEPTTATAATPQPEEDASSSCDEASSFVSVSPGVYVQQPEGSTRDEVSFEEEPTGNRRSAFGAQTLAVFSDAQCAYAAVSADGLRCVQAIGTWEVINGNFVIGGSQGNADVKHFRLVGVGQQEIVAGASYAEPIAIPLEDLVARFDPPISLSECVLRIGHSLRDEMLRVRIKRSKHCQVAASVANRSQSAPRKTLVGFSESPRPSRKTVVSATPRSTIASTRSTVVAARATIKEPRLSESIGASTMSSMGRSFSRSYTSATAMLGDEQAPQATVTVASAEECPSFPTCPLRPGNYHYEKGFPGAFGYGLLDMRLHADGRYSFTETSFVTVVRLINQEPLWRVEGDVLILGCRDSNAHAFISRCPRGTKDAERRIMSISIPVATLLKRCTYTDFPQFSDPFPGHTLTTASQCICGVIDPASPALSDPPAALDRIPLRAVEAELHDMGLHSDELLSDLIWLDSSNDGMIGPEELEGLKNYGKADAAPEQLAELSESLLKRFGSLNDAFEACVKVAQDSNLAAEGAAPASKGDSAADEALHKYDRKCLSDTGINCLVFEKFLQDVVQKDAKDKKLKAKIASLKAWLAKTSSEDIKAVFTSINVSEGPTIDLVDFLTLSLHAAMSSMQRLAHFQSWICQRFGRSEDSFEHAFATLDTKHVHKLTMKTFLQATQQFGYPCSPAVSHCIFGLLDRNFKGSITVKEFQSLRSFNSAKLLQGLQNLKKFADEKFGGLDECFAKLLQLERVQRKLSGKATSVSYKTFEKALTQGGFKQAFADADLEMLFLFLDEASDQSTSGCLTHFEWQLLRGFEARAITGSPARLRRFLEDKFSDMEEAYQHLQASWQARVVRERLTQEALNGLVRALRSCAHDGGLANFRGAARAQSKGVSSAAPQVTKAPASPRAGFTKAHTSVLPAADGGLFSAIRRPTSRLAERPSSRFMDAEAQRPHTHEGCRTTSGSHVLPASMKPLALHNILAAAAGPARHSARRPGSKSTTYSLPYESPALPMQLRTEQWEPEASHHHRFQLESETSRRCTSAPSADQKGLGATLRPVAPLMPSAASPRCVIQLFEKQPSFSARCRGTGSRGGSRGGWSSRGCGATSAIDWDVM